MHFNKKLSTLLWPTFLLTLLFSSPTLFADSPITSTNISAGYSELAIVKEAANAQGALTDPILRYLCNANEPVDVKIAVISALSWGDQHQRASLLGETLMKQEKRANKTALLENTSADNLICLAYLQAMDNYFEVGEALGWARKACMRNTSSYTIHLVCALIEAQQALDTDWCAVYTVCDKVRKNQSLTTDLRQMSELNIFEYIDGYAQFCK